MQNTNPDLPRPHYSFDGCDVVDLARRYGTPLYVMSERMIKERLKLIKRTIMDGGKGDLAVYASKAFQTLDMIRTVAESGLGMDVVSGGELHAALAGGMDPALIYFHGNGKTDAELREAVVAGVGHIVVDSGDELEALERVAAEAGKVQPILFRITPGVDSHTHAYVSTGSLDSKFGIPAAPEVRDALVLRAMEAPHIELLGFHCHIGSQLLSNESHLLTVTIMVDLIHHVREATGFLARELNLGGGFGVKYVQGDEPLPLNNFVEPVIDAVERRCQERGIERPRLVFEPGRWIVAEAGITVYTVVAVKEIPGIKTWAAVDGGMFENPRPALYDARYEAVVANKADQEPERAYSIAGKCCESGDVLIQSISLPALQAGDTLAMFTTGAYTHSMASNYNRNLRPALVLTDAGKHRLSVRRETYEDLLARERF